MFPNLTKWHAPLPSWQAKHPDLLPNPAPTHSLHPIISIFPA